VRNEDSKGSNSLIAPVKVLNRLKSVNWIWQELIKKLEKRKISEFIKKIEEILEKKL